MHFGWIEDKIDQWQQYFGEIYQLSHRNVEGQFTFDANGDIVVVVSIQVSLVVVIVNAKVFFFSICLLDN